MIRDFDFRVVSGRSTSPMWSIGTADASVSGLARAMARCVCCARADASVKESARVAIADIEFEPLKIAEGELRRAGAEVVAVQTNVADPSSVDALAKATVKAFGRVDIACNNAGIGESLRPIWEFSRSY